MTFYCLSRPVSGLLVQQPRLIPCLHRPLEAVTPVLQSFLMSQENSSPLRRKVYKAPGCTFQACTPSCPKLDFTPPSPSTLTCVRSQCRNTGLTGEDGAGKLHLSGRAGPSPAVSKHHDLGHCDLGQCSFYRIHCYCLIIWTIGRIIRVITYLLLQ